MIINNSFSFIYNPNLDYSEKDIFNKDNKIYKAVEKLLFNLGLDRENFSKSSWNPLMKLIKPKDKVVIKPNFVSIRDRELNLSDEEIFSVSTSPQVLKPIIDYVWKALEGKGKISIVDSPLEGTNFKELLNRLGVFKLIEQLKMEKVNIEILDLRDFIFERKMLIDNFIFNNYSINIGLLLRKKQKGDPQGYRIVDLKDKSYLVNDRWDYTKLRFHRANPKIPLKYHSLTKNVYSISKTVLESDVFINVPKLKTHKKTGVTLSLKSLIGITNRKHWLPHYRCGTPPKGDEFPQKLSFMEELRQKLSRLPLPFGHSLIVNIVNKKSHQKVITEGGWVRNDTLWRAILDLNKILFYADKKGNIQNTIQRKYLSIIDGIRGGEGDGPLRPTPKHAGFLIAGFNPVVLDALVSNMMGFDYHLIKQITKGLNLFQIKAKELDRIINKFDGRHKINLRFRPPFGWESLVKQN